MYILHMVIWLMLDSIHNSGVKSRVYVTDVNLAYVSIEFVWCYLVAGDIFDYYLAGCWMLVLGLACLLSC